MRFKLTLLLAFCCAASHAETISFTNGSFSPDRKTLNFHFGSGADQIVKHVTLPDPVVDVKRCEFIPRDGGVAFIAATSKPDGTHAYYYGTFFASTDDDQIYIKSIKAPPGKWLLVGIVNSEGDSLIATAVAARQPGKPDQIDGWMLVDHCAHPIIKETGGVVVQTSTTIKR